MTTATEQSPEVTETVEEVESSPETAVAETQAAPETPKAFDPASIAPEVKSYYEKEYVPKTEYEKAAQAANQFAQVQADPRYRQWVESLNKPQAPQFTITPEDHAAALGDPTKFQELVMKAANHVASTQFAPKVEQFEREAQFNKASMELSQTISRHPEFKELDKNGHILPVLQRYPGISFDDALAIAKQQTGWEAKEAAKKAAGEVQVQKRAMTERPGNPTSTTRGKKKFKTTSDALEWIADEHAAGRAVDPDEWESED